MGQTLSARPGEGGWRFPFWVFWREVFAARVAQVAEGLLVVAFGLRFPRGKFGSGRKHVRIRERGARRYGEVGGSRGYNPNSRGAGLLRFLVLEVVGCKSLLLPVFGCF